MNILLIHCHYRFPGGEDAVFAAERAMLTAQGHTVTVYERSNEEAAAGLQKLLLPLHALYNFAAARRVRRIIADNQIELVHVHNTLLLLSPGVVRAAKAAGAAVVQTLHNFRLFCPNGVLLRGDAVCEDCPRHGLACAIRHKCYRGSTLQSAVVAACYALHRRLGTYRGVQIVTLTEFDKQKLLEFNAMHPTPMFDADKLCVRPNPVAFEADLPLPWPQRKNQVLYAGRLENLKGLPTVLQAWRIMGESAPKLLIAGTGPLESWAKQNATEQVRFLGQISPAQLHETMRESRAVIAASLCYESFALVPAEALAAGTPVLASDLGNVGAAVQEGVTGYHFAPGDAAALTVAVRRICDKATSFDPAAIAKAARQTYNRQASYDSLLSIYHAALARKGGDIPHQSEEKR